MDSLLRLIVQANIAGWRGSGREGTHLLLFPCLWIPMRSLLRGSGGRAVPFVAGAEHGEFTWRPPTAWVWLLGTKVPAQLPKKRSLPARPPFPAWSQGDSKQDRGAARHVTPLVRISKQGSKKKFIKPYKAYSALPYSLFDSTFTDLGASLQGSRL